MRSFINGIKLSWDDIGSGPAVCLVHGFPLNRFMWRQQIQPLTDAGFRVITPDLRGFGESEAPDGDYSMDLFADDLVSLLDHLGVEKALIGGMSMGGYVLLNLIERHPQRVSAACFIVTRSGADDDAGKERRLQLSRDVMMHGPKVVADIFAKVLFAEQTVLEHPELVADVYRWMNDNDPRGLSGALLAMRGRKDYTPHLAGFRLPCLVIGAENDKAIPSEQSLLLADGLPEQTLAIIPEAGHMANLEQPEAFNRCLIDFLRANWPG
jgi:3-oxoadipate enol-lactonase